MRRKMEGKFLVLTTLSLMVLSKLPYTAGQTEDCIMVEKTTKLQLKDEIGRICEDDEYRERSCEGRCYSDYVHEPYDTLGILAISKVCTVKRYDWVIRELNCGPGIQKNFTIPKIQECGCGICNSDNAICGNWRKRGSNSLLKTPRNNYLMDIISPPVKPRRREWTQLPPPFRVEYAYP